MRVLMREGEAAKAAREQYKAAIDTLESLLQTLHQLSQGVELPGPSAFARAMSGGCRRGYQSGEAILDLAQSQFGVEALIVTRSLWELFLGMEYLQQHTGDQREELAIRYIAHNGATRSKAIAALSADPQSGSVSPAAQARFDHNDAFLFDTLKSIYVSRGMNVGNASRKARSRLDAWRDSPFWSGLETSRLAQAITKRPGRDREAEYGWLYPFLSQYAHAAGATILGFGAELDDEWDLFYRLHTSKLACQMAFNYLVGLNMLVSDEFGLNWTVTLRALHT